MLRLRRVISAGAWRLQIYNRKSTSQTGGVATQALLHRFEPFVFDCLSQVLQHHGRAKLHHWSTPIKSMGLKKGVDWFDFCVIILSFTLTSIKRFVKSATTNVCMYVYTVYI